MLKSEARGGRGRQQVEWEWRQAWGGDLDEDATAQEPQREMLWEAEMWAVWQKEARRSRLEQRKAHDRSERP